MWEFLSECSACMFPRQYWSKYIFDWSSIANSCLNVVQLGSHPVSADWKGEWRRVNQQHVCRCSPFSSTAWRRWFTIERILNGHLIIMPIPNLIWKLHNWNNIWIIWQMRQMEIIELCHIFDPGTCCWAKRHNIMKNYGMDQRCPRACLSDKTSCLTALCSRWRSRQEQQVTHQGNNSPTLHRLKVDFHNLHVNNCSWLNIDIISDIIPQNCTIKFSPLGNLLYFSWYWISFETIFFP